MPHGICIFESDQGRGVGVFTNGKIFGGPGWGELKEHGIITSVEKCTKTLKRGIIRVY